MLLGVFGLSGEFAVEISQYPPWDSLAEILDTPTVMVVVLSWVDEYPTFVALFNEEGADLVPRIDILRGDIPLHFILHSSTVEFRDLFSLCLRLGEISPDLLHGGSCP